MDQNGERRSRVPAGTFGSSQPPSETGRRSAATPASDAAADRRRFIDTLSGQKTPLAEEAEAAELEAPAPAPAAPTPNPPERQGTGTLVGHPQVPPPQAGTQSAPVLSPPKWRGARAYMEGEEPQPRISSIPTPQVTAASAPVKPVGVAIGVLRSKVTTKVGLPTRPVPQPGPAGEQEPAIDDTIQQMLERHPSVAMQVEDPPNPEDSIPELAIDDLAILDDSSARVPVPVTASPPPPPPAVTRSEAPAARAQDSAAAPPAQAALKPAADAAAAESARPAARSAPERHAPVRKEQAPAAGREREASSLEPPEVLRGWRRSDSSVGLGALFIAAIVLVGGGGWLVTRGGYVGSHPPPVATAAVAPSPAAVAPAVQPANPAPPAVPAPSAPAVPSSTQRATPARDDEGASERSATRREARSAREEKQAERERTPEPQQEEQASESAKEAPAPAATNEGDRSVLTVKPRAEQSTELPDIPSREDVIAALDPLRPAVNECAHGQRGTAQLDITVASTGQVSHAVVGGDFSGTPEGSCIARAARTAQFTPFKKPRFRVIYPFQL